MTCPILRPILALLLSSAVSFAYGKCIHPIAYEVKLDQTRTTFLIASYHVGPSSPAACVDSLVRSIFKRTKTIYFEMIPNDEPTETAYSKELLALKLPKAELEVYTAAVIKAIQDLEKKYGPAPRILKLHPVMVRNLIFATCASSHTSMFGMDVKLKELAEELNITVENLWDDLHQTIELARKVPVGDWIRDTLAAAAYAVQGCQPSLSPVLDEAIDAYAAGHLEQLWDVGQRGCQISGSCVVEDAVVWAPQRTEALANTIVRLAGTIPPIVVLGASHVTSGSGLFAALRRAGAHVSLVSSPP